MRREKVEEKIQRLKKMRDEILDYLLFLEEKFGKYDKEGYLVYVKLPADKFDEFYFKIMYFYWVARDSIIPNK